MAEYADIAELDQDAFDIRHSWNVTMKHASSFAWKFRAVEEKLRSGRFGPEWTFARWLVAKCGMSLRTSYRVIRDLERTATEDDRQRTQDALTEIRKQEVQEKTDRRASQLAWNGWLLDEKIRKAATQSAWDEWKEQEKQRIVAERDAEKQAKLAERKREQRRERDRRYHERRRDTKKEQNNKALEVSTRSDGKKEKSLPTMAITPNWQADLVTVLNILGDVLLTVPVPDRHMAISQLVAWAEKFTNDFANGEYASEKASVKQWRAWN